MTFSATYLQLHNLQQIVIKPGTRTPPPTPPRKRGGGYDVFYMIENRCRSQEEELEGDKNSPNYPKFICVYLRSEILKICFFVKIKFPVAIQYKI